MTLEVTLTQILKEVCPRSFPDFAPVGTERPYITWQQIGGEAPEFLDRAVPSKENAFVQVNVWADKREEAKALIKQVEEKLVETTLFQAGPMAAAVSDFDTDTARRCSRQDFTIWADR